MGKEKFYDLAGNIISYESDELSASKILELFSELIKSGLAWTLQGSYGRTAQRLIEGGFIDKNGDILKSISE